MTDATSEHDELEASGTIDGATSAASTTGNPTVTENVGTELRCGTVSTMVGASTADKVALITGSTSGIGLGIAQVLAARGYAIMFNGLVKPEDMPAVDAIRADITAKHNVKTAFNGANLMDPKACRALVEDTIKTFGRIDVVVNNAGIQHVAPVKDFPADKWDAVIALNLSAAFHMTQAALPQMEKQGYGRIVNIASTHGLVASPNKCAYVTAKHGLIGFTKAVAIEYADKGITSNAICPGWVLTPLVAAQIQKMADESPADAKLDFEGAKKKLLLEKEPSGKFTTPEEIGAMVEFLVGPAAGNMTGIAWANDGAWTVH